MRYLLLLLLVGCMDSSVSSEVNNTVVYQFAEITVGDTVPSTFHVWSADDARAVIALTETTHKLSIEHCEHASRPSRRRSCYFEREQAIRRIRDHYIRDLQILGVR